MAKSEVAAERVKLINPHIRVYPLTSKMDDSVESKRIFSHAFWGVTDVVLTALVIIHI